MPEEPFFTPFTDTDAVLAYLGETLTKLRRMFTDGCAQAADQFAKRQWKHFDPNLYAYEVRKEVHEALLSEGHAVELEEADLLKVESMSLCGLLLKQKFVHLRVRRSKTGDVPKADGNLLDFYQANLFPDSAAEGEATSSPNDGAATPLNLMLLWDVDARRQFRHFWLGCPKKDGTQWHWRQAIFAENASGAEAIDHAEAFRAAFQAENSDVPMTRVEGERIKRATGTDDKTGL